MNITLKDGTVKSYEAPVSAACARFPLHGCAFYVLLFFSRNSSALPPSRVLGLDAWIHKGV